MPTTPDDTDLMQAGALPNNPFADTVPMLDPAEAEREREREAAALRLDGERLGTFADDELDRMRARGDGRSRPVPLPPRWTKTADELRGGLWPGCYVLVGATGTGKTQWAFEVAYHAATGRDAVPVLYIGLELDRAGMLARLAALASRSKGGIVSWSSLYLGDGGAIDRATKAGVIAELAAAPLYLVRGEARGWSYSDLDPKVAAMRRRHPTGPALVILDFLQLVSSPADAREDLRERIGAAAYAARMAAVRYDATVLVLSATARGFYPLFAGGKVSDGGDVQPLGSGDPARFLGTGKEAGEVEYAADGVIALCREPDGPGRKSWIAVAKSRTGRPERGNGWIAYGFDGTTFTEDASALPSPKGRPASDPNPKPPQKKMQA